MVMNKFIILLLLGVCQGSAFVFMKVGGQEIPPITLVFIRVFLASIPLMAIVVGVYQINLFEALYQNSREFAFLTVFSTSLPFCLLTWAEKSIDSGVVAIYMATIPMFVAIVEKILHKKRLGAWGCIGLLVGFSGVLLLVYRPNAYGGLDMHHIACISASIAYAFSVVIGKRLNAIRPIVISTNVLILSAVLLLPLSFLETS